MGQVFIVNFFNLPGTPILALTASADIKSRSRVSRLLHMDNVSLIASPNKTNIRLGLCKVPSSSSLELPGLDCATCKRQGLNDATNINLLPKPEISGESFLIFKGGTARTCLGRL